MCVYIYIYTCMGGVPKISGAVLGFHIIRDSDSIWDLGVHIAVPLLMVTNICKRRKIWYIG